MNRGLEVSAPFVDASRFLVVGRGYNYATAFEIALKIKETSYVLAEPYSIADLLHGPMAMVEKGLPIMIVAPSGRTLETMSEHIAEFERRGAARVVISDRDELLDRAQSPIPLPKGVPEWISPIVAIMPGQLEASPP